MSSRWHPHLFLALANLFYGANYTIAKVAMPEYLSPFGFILVRVTIALLLFTMTNLLFVRERVQLKDLPLLALCGLFGVAINQLMFFKGLSLTSEIHASLIMISAPILVLVFSRLILRERITVLKMTGIALGASGVIWLIAQGAGPRSGQASALGDLFVLINASSYGLYLVLVKPLMKRYNPLTVINIVFFFGWLVVTPVGWSEFTAVAWSELPGTVWASVIYVVVFTTFFAYLFNTLALKEASPSLVSSYIYTQPLIASMIAVLVGNDRLTWYKVAASLLILSGVYLVSSYRPGTRKPANP